MTHTIVSFNGDWLNSFAYLFFNKKHGWLQEVPPLIPFHDHLSNQLRPRRYLCLHLLRIFHQVIFSLLRVTYRSIGERNKNRQDVQNVLDIGTATGGPLSTIISYFSPKTRILGIDYNKHYVPACQKLFKHHSNVEIKHMNYYDLEKEEPKTLFDVIIFGSSFMILPDQTKALEIAQRKLSKNGRIYFLLTLYE